MQPGQTRWLSYEGSVAVILRHYTAIRLALEQIYVDAGDMSSEAGGLLLTLRKESTLVLLNVLHFFLQPLARLSKALQSANSNLATAMDTVKATIAGLNNDFNMDTLRQQCTTAAEGIVGAGVRLEIEDAAAKRDTNKICLRFHKTVVKNLNSRFSDDISSLCMLQTILSEKPDFGTISKVLDVPASELLDEWKFVKRLPCDFSIQKDMITFATSPVHSATFPAWQQAILTLLLLPLGTASVECSFSTMKRILTSDRCRLLPDHYCQLMLLSIEGPPVPDVRLAKESEEVALAKLIDADFDHWCASPRRGIE